MHGETNDDSATLRATFSAWLAAVDGLDVRLRAGAQVADVACGAGATTLLLAKSFPRSRFFGCDSFAPAIERARAGAVHDGLTERVRFAVGDTADLASGAFDVVTMLGSVRALREPLVALGHVLRALAADGLLVLVEPDAVDARIPLEEAGFTRVRRTAAAPLHLVLEARR